MKNVQMKAPVLSEIYTQKMYYTCYELACTMPIAKNCKKFVRKGKVSLGLITQDLHKSRT